MIQADYGRGVTVTYGYQDSEDQWTSLTGPTIGSARVLATEWKRSRESASYRPWDRSGKRWFRKENWMAWPCAHAAVFRRIAEIASNGSVRGDARVEADASAPVVVSTGCACAAGGGGRGLPAGALALFLALALARRSVRARRVADTTR